MYVADIVQSWRSNALVRPRFEFQAIQFSAARRDTRVIKEDKRKKRKKKHRHLQDLNLEYKLV